MPGVGDDQPDVGVAVDERGEVVADRRQAAAAVDQDRDVALDREREDVVEALVAERELLRPWMELDPAGAEVEAAGRLLDRPLVEVEADERDDPVGVLRGVRERAVVRRGERRHAVGLVEAERERARDPDPVEHREHLVGPAAHPVDVVAEVRVGVEEHRPGGNLREDAVGDSSRILLRALERLHASEPRP